VGPPDRHRAPEPPARGSRGGPRAGAGAVRGWSRLRARHARAGARVGGLGHRARRRSAQGHPRRRGPDRAGRGPADRDLARPGGGPCHARDDGSGDQRHLDRAAGGGERAPLPAHR
jgi:hypothetical protein